MAEDFGPNISRAMHARALQQCIANIDTCSANEIIRDFSSCVRLAVGINLRARASTFQNARGRHSRRDKEGFSAQLEPSLIQTNIAAPRAFDGRVTCWPIRSRLDAAAAIEENRSAAREASGDTRRRHHPKASQGMPIL